MRKKTLNLQIGTTQIKFFFSFMDNLNIVLGQGFHFTILLCTWLFFSDRSNYSQLSLINSRYIWYLHLVCCSSNKLINSNPSVIQGFVEGAHGVHSTNSRTDVDTKCKKMAYINIFPTSNTVFIQQHPLELHIWSYACQTPILLLSTTTTSM